MSSLIDHYPIRSDTLVSVYQTGPEWFDEEWKFVFYFPLLDDVELHITFIIDDDFVDFIDVEFEITVFLGTTIIPSEPVCVQWYRRNNVYNLLRTFLHFDFYSVFKNQNRSQTDIIIMMEYVQQVLEHKCEMKSLTFGSTRYDLIDIGDIGGKEKSTEYFLCSYEGV